MLAGVNKIASIRFLHNVAHFAFLLSGFSIVYGRVSSYLITNNTFTSNIEFLVRQAYGVPLLNPLKMIGLFFQCIVFG
jgi:hypothetical protein